MKNPLSDMDQIHASDELKQKTLSYIYQKRRDRIPYLPVLGGALICVLFLIWGILPHYQNDPAIPSTPAYASYISLDINPSIELRLDEQNIILDTMGYNEEGSELLAQIQPKGYDLAECLQMMMENDMFQQYMEHGHLQISIYSEDEERIRELQTTMETALSHHYGSDQFDCHNASDKDYEQASHHHMSMGCYQMIEKILAEDESYRFEELSQLNIAELREIYRECRQSHRGHGQGNHHNHQ